MCALYALTPSISTLPSSAAELSSGFRLAHLVEEGAEEEVPLLHRPEGGLHLDRVHAARQVAVLEQQRRLDPLGRLLLQHLEQQMVGLRVVEAPVAVIITWYYMMFNAIMLIPCLLGHARHAFSFLPEEVVIVSQVSFPLYS